MQSFDGDKLVSTDQGTLDELKEKIKEMEGKTTHSVIGRLPEKGQKITINGLNYTITYVDKALGKFHARIIRPENS